MMTATPAPATLDGVRAILCDLLLRKPEDVHAESLLVQDLELDSLGLIELTFAIEERFGVQFPDLKASAEMLVLPLPEGVRRIEAMPGGTTLFEFIKRALVGDGSADAFDRATVADLARVVRGPVPIALESTRPLAELHLADLFRLVTVGILARYVDVLRA